MGAGTMPQHVHHECELAIIGAGMAGMAAALFAVTRGLSVAQVGGTGGILFASGVLDLLGVHPIEEGKCWGDPWEGIDALRRDCPLHPLARIETRDIGASLEEFFLFLEDAGLRYTTFGQRNVEMVTPLGTLRQSYGLPQTMRNGVLALHERSPCLIVDLQGFKEFNASQFVATLLDQWPTLRPARISFPGTERMSRVFARHMALALELPEHLEQLAQRVRPLVKGAQAVGMPAIFGLRRSHEIVARFEGMIGAPVFEIPTLPASVPGFRLKETLESHLPARGVKPFYQSKVLKVSKEGGNLVLSLGNHTTECTMRAKGIILATGRFFGKGLSADRGRIRETILDLPVHQPETRALWHHRDLMDPRGHPVNRAGLEVDDSFRPLASSGLPGFHTLFASGSILAHQDWIRMKCGSGLAIATSYAAVKAFCDAYR